MATTSCGALIYCFGILSAVSGGEGFWGEGLKQILGMTWFDTVDYLASNWLIPLGGIGMSLFVGWQMNYIQRKTEFQDGSWLGSFLWLYWIWVFLLRWLVPSVILVVMLHSLKIL